MQHVLAAVLAPPNGAGIKASEEACEPVQCLRPPIHPPTDRHARWRSVPVAGRLAEPSLDTPLDTPIHSGFAAAGPGVRERPALATLGRCAMGARVVLLLELRVIVQQPAPARTWHEAFRVRRGSKTREVRDEEGDGNVVGVYDVALCEARSSRVRHA